MKHKKPLGVIFGVIGSNIVIPIHETGHYLVAKALDKNPHYDFTSGWDKIEVLTDRVSDLEAFAINLGAPSLEYSAAFALAYLGRKIDRVHHRTLKEAVKEWEKSF